MRVRGARRRDKYSTIEPGQRGGERHHQPSRFIGSTRRGEEREGGRLEIGKRVARPSTRRRDYPNGQVDRRWTHVQPTLGHVPFILAPMIVPVSQPPDALSRAMRCLTHGISGKPWRCASTAIPAGSLLSAPCSPSKRIRSRSRSPLVIWVLGEGSGRSFPGDPLRSRGDDKTRSSVFFAWPFDPLIFLASGTVSSRRPGYPGISVRTGQASCSGDPRCASKLEHGRAFKLRHLLDCSAGQGMLLLYILPIHFKGIETNVVDVGAGRGGLMQMKCTMHTTRVASAACGRALATVDRRCSSS